MVQGSTLLRVRGGQRQAKRLVWRHPAQLRDFGGRCHTACDVDPEQVGSDLLAWLIRRGGLVLPYVDETPWSLRQLLVKLTY